MIRPISIALIYGKGKSLEYAKLMKKVMEEDNSCLILPRLVDGIDGNVWEYIEGVFSEVDYAIVFLTQAYRVEEVIDVNRIQKRKKKDKKCATMSTPNLMLEYGYMLHKLNKNITVVADFEYKLIENRCFLFPTDKSGTGVQAYPALYVDDEREMVIQTIWGKIKKKLSDCNLLEDDMSFESLLTENYKPNIKNVFVKEMQMGINQYSLEWQYKEVLDQWKLDLKKMEVLASESGRKEIITKYKIAYLFERILFLFIFKGFACEGCSEIEYKRIDFSGRYDDTFGKEYVNLYRELCNYIFEKRGKYSNEANDKERDEKKDLLDIASNIEECLDELDKGSFVAVLAKNYAGLCYLNAAGNASQELLKKADKYFAEVMDSSINFCNNDSLDDVILRAYAGFNLARTRAREGGEYEDYNNLFQLSIDARENLFKCKDFPEFIRLYWQKEVYHAENYRIDMCKEYWKTKGYDEEIKKAKEKSNEIISDLEKQEKTTVSMQDFFKQIKVDAKRNLENLEGI